MLEQAVEKVAKYFRAIKAYLLGDVESEAKPEQIERMLAELAAPRFFYSAVANLAKFEFEVSFVALRVLCSHSKS